MPSGIRRAIIPHNKQHCIIGRYIKKGLCLFSWQTIRKQRKLSGCIRLVYGSVSQVWECRDCASSVANDWVRWRQCSQWLRLIWLKILAGSRWEARSKMSQWPLNLPKWNCLCTDVLANARAPKCFTQACIMPTHCPPWTTLLLWSHLSNKAWQ